MQHWRQRFSHRWLRWRCRRLGRAQQLIRLLGARVQHCRFWNRLDRWRQAQLCTRRRAVRRRRRHARRRWWRHARRRGRDRAHRRRRRDARRRGWALHTCRRFCHLLGSDLRRCRQCGRSDTSQTLRVRPRHAPYGSRSARRRRTTSGGLERLRGGRRLSRSGSRPLCGLGHDSPTRFRLREVARRRDRRFVACRSGGPVEQLPTAIRVGWLGVDGGQGCAHGRTVRQRVAPLARGIRGRRFRGMLAVCSTHALPRSSG